MIILTADVLPAPIKLIQVHGLIECTYATEISKKPLFQRLFNRKRNDQKGPAELLTDAARRLGPGNVIYGLRISTTAVNFVNGTFLYTTYCGTLASCEIEERSELASLAE